MFSLDKILGLTIKKTHINKWKQHPVSKLRLHFQDLAYSSILQMVTSLVNVKTIERIMSDSVVGKAFALYITDLEMAPGIPSGALQEWSLSVEPV